MFCTSLCRTMSPCSNSTAAIPLTPRSFSSASSSPLSWFGGRSICVVSPVMIIFESCPSRVKNISICDGVVFCALSRMITLSFSVRPRMNASGITSITSFDHEPLDLLEVDHVVQRIEKRPKIRIDLGLQVARQKPQPLPRLHRRPRQHDPLRLPRLQHARRHRHRQVRLPRPRRPDAERQVVLQHRLDVPLLTRRLRLDRVPLRINVDLPVARRSRTSCARLPIAVPDVLRRSASPAAAASSASAPAPPPPCSPAHSPPRCAVIVPAHQLHPERIADHAADTGPPTRKVPASYQVVRGKC